MPISLKTHRSQKGHEDLFLIHHKQERGIFMTRIKNIISNQLNLAERGRIETLLLSTLIPTRLLTSI